MVGYAEAIEAIPETSGAERVIADFYAIGAPALDAKRVGDSVRLWFHTFALAPGINTPGIARNHGYRLGCSARIVLRAVARSMWACLTASTASSRSAAARVALSRSTNEQYVDWVHARLA